MNLKLLPTLYSKWEDNEIWALCTRYPIVRSLVEVALLLRNYLLPGGSAFSIEELYRTHLILGEGPIIDLDITGVVKRGRPRKKYAIITRS